MNKISKFTLVGVILLSVFYTAIGFLGGYIYPIYIFAGFFGVPLTVFVYRQGIQPIVIGAILATTGVIAVFMSIGAWIVLLCIGIIPAVVCGMLYYKQAPLLRIILGTGLSYFGGIIAVFLIYQMIYGQNIVHQYYHVTREIESWTAQRTDQKESRMIKQLPQLQEVYKEVSLFKWLNINLSEDQIIQYHALKRLKDKKNFYYLQHLFPSLLFILSFVFGLTQVICTRVLFYILQWKASSLKTLFSFSITPVVPLLFIGMMIFSTGMGEDKYRVLSMAFDNMQVIFGVAMFLVGIFLIIHLIRVSPSGALFKIFIVFFSILGLYFSPIMFVMIGFIEGLFNFRRVKRFL